VQFAFLNCPVQVEPWADSSVRSVPLHAVHAASGVEKAVIVLRRLSSRFGQDAVEGGEEIEVPDRCVSRQ